MSWQPPSVDELTPTDMSYASVHETTNCQDFYVVDLDTQKVMDGVQSVDIKEGVAYCLSNVQVSTMTVVYRDRGEVTYTGCQNINVDKGFITFTGFIRGALDGDLYNINIDSVESWLIDDQVSCPGGKAIPISGRYQIYIMSDDCRHGFVVRSVVGANRFQCKECGDRFRSYPTVRKNA